MARILTIDSVLSEEEQEAVQDALEELSAQLFLYQSLENCPGCVEDEKRQASKVINAMRKLAYASTDIQTKGHYLRKLQIRRFSNADREERRVQVNSLLKEFALSIDSHENLGSKVEVITPVEEAWKTALDELNKQLVLYDGLERVPEQVPEQTSEEWQATKVVAAMYKVSATHTDPKVKEEYLKKAETFKKATPGERRKGLNELLEGLLVLLATPFALAGAVVLTAGSVLYGVGSIVKGLGTMLTGGLFDSAFHEVYKKSDASKSDQEKRD